MKSQRSPNVLYMDRAIEHGNGELKALPNVEGVRSTDNIGRIYTVHPNNSECFFLRILSYSIQGLQVSIQVFSLKTVDGQLCQTFRDACSKHGLLKDAEHWYQTLEDAKQNGASKMPVK
eukprot:GHVR01181574.1.p1 GENE.GHVR01181574.1~~GHVR01181574.1.p1  ORF type:complete len:119 (-),score=6.14 GHVR01181574.1:253-609(-)